MSGCHRFGKGQLHQCRDRQRRYRRWVKYHGTRRQRTRLCVLRHGQWSRQQSWDAWLCCVESLGGSRHTRSCRRHTRGSGDGTWLDFPLMRILIGKRGWMEASKQCASVHRRLVYSFIDKGRLSIRTRNPECARIFFLGGPRAWSCELPCLASVRPLTFNNLSQSMVIR